jgi:hypothetical protein
MRDEGKSGRPSNGSVGYIGSHLVAERMIIDRLRQHFAGRWRQTCQMAAVVKFPARAPQARKRQPPLRCKFADLSPSKRAGPMMIVEPKIYNHRLYDWQNEAKIINLFK